MILLTDRERKLLLGRRFATHPSDELDIFSAQPQRIAVAVRLWMSSLSTAVARHAHTSPLYSHFLKLRREMHANFLDEGASVLLDYLLSSGWAASSETILETCEAFPDDAHLTSELRKEHSSLRALVALVSPLQVETQRHFAALTLAAGPMLGSTATYHFFTPLSAARCAVFEGRMERGGREDELVAARRYCATAEALLSARAWEESTNEARQHGGERLRELTSEEWAALHAQMMLQEVSA